MVAHVFKRRLLGIMLWSHWWGCCVLMVARVVSFKRHLLALMLCSLWRGRRVLIVAHALFQTTPFGTYAVFAVY